ncbi:MAG: protein-tyrosine phosphatase [Paenibacillus sp.]|jgi:protein-tyrosine phosphatase|nr:protein-tyrosine phosphatase [Paenibacillus sp.]
MSQSDKTYQSLHERKIFIGGAQDVKELIEDEKVEVIVDLRAETSEAQDHLPEHVTRIHVPLVDKESGQEQLLKQAVDQVVNAYKAGKPVAFHCAAGRSRAGSVAIGTLLELGISATVEEAEARVQEIRPEVAVHEELKKSLSTLYNDIKND